MSIFSSSLVLY